VSRTVTLLLAGVALTLASAGCGPAGPKLVKLSGTVTFKGQPVPAGYISFLPPSGGGVQRVVQIKDGKYDTAEMQGDEKGVHPGPNQVRIAGFDGKVIKFYGQGKQIFNPVDEQYTVPDAGGTKDFVVPESAGKNVKIEPTSDE
jgi:hypothetical protein